MTLYAMHDALVKFMPGAPQGKSLAESWLVSKDGLVYEFVLRKGVTFHNGDPVTADDVKFSFERYRGAAAKLLKDRVAAVEIVDPHKMRFRLKKPWLDFMTFFATPATGAAWIVPKKYVEKVGEDGFKKAPVGAGPYRFVSFKPGVELVLEAYEGYWRKAPAVKRLVFRVIPDESTRLAALKRGEVDMSVRDIKAPSRKFLPLQAAPGLVDGWLRPPDTARTTACQRISVAQGTGGDRSKRRANKPRRPWRPDGAHALSAAAWLVSSDAANGGARSVSSRDAATAARIARIASGSSTVPSKRKRPPQREHASTSISNARLIRSAHAQCRETGAAAESSFPFAEAPAPTGASTGGAP